MYKFHDRLGMVMYMMMLSMRAGLCTYKRVAHVTIDIFIYRLNIYIDIFTMVKNRTESVFIIIKSKTAMVFSYDKLVASIVLCQNSI